MCFPVTKRSFRKSNRCFSLVELLVAICVLTILGLLLSQMLIMVSNTWKIGRSQADNFSQARSALDLIAGDIEGGVIRPDLPAFFSGNSDALIFYTKQQGLKASSKTGNRPFSAVSYSVINVGGTNSMLRRTASGFDYGDAVNYTASDWNVTTTGPSFDSDIGPGVLLMKYQFISTNGVNVLPNQVNPTWTNSMTRLGIRSLRAVIISVAVIDSENIKLLQSAGKLEQLRSNLSTNNPGAIRSYRSLWQDQIDSASRPLTSGGIPPQALRGLRTFERAVMLPQPLGQ